MKIYTNVIIEMTQNGYIVRTFNYRHEESVSEWFSFESFESMMEWLKKNMGRQVEEAK